MNVNIHVSNLMQNILVYDVLYFKFALMYWESKPSQ